MLKSRHRNKPVLFYKEFWMQENGLNNFRTILSEVSSFVRKGTLYIIILAWDPSDPKVTESYSRRLSAINLKTKLRTFLWVFRVHNQNLRQISQGVPELWSANKQTNRDYNFLYIYNHETLKFDKHFWSFFKLLKSQHIMNF